MLDHYISIPHVKVRKWAKIRNRYNQVPSNPIQASIDELIGLSKYCQRQPPDGKSWTDAFKWYYLIHSYK